MALKRDLEFLYEIGTLKNTERSWQQFMGSGCASVPEHTFRVIFLALLILFNENYNATKGYKLRTLERERSQLLLTEEVLNMHIAESQAMETMLNDPMITTMIPTPGNRWVGNNRGAWSSPAVDRLYDRFNAELNRDRLPGILAEAMKAVSDEVGVIPLYYSYVASAHVAGLTGPRVETGLTNIYQWEWK